MIPRPYAFPILLAVAPVGAAEATKPAAPASAVPAPGVPAPAPGMKRFIHRPTLAGRSGRRRRCRSQEAGQRHQRGQPCEVGAFLRKP